MATNINTPLLAAGVVLGGLIGGWFGATLGTPSPEAEADLHADYASPAPSNSEELEKISRSLESLQIEFDLMRSDLDRVSRTASAPAADGTNGGRRQVDAPPAAFAGPPAEISEEQLGVMLDRRDAQKEEDRRARDAERRQERINRQMEQYQEMLGLTDAQTHDMGLILNQASAKRSDLFREMRESGDFDRDTIRETMGAMREETNTALSGILTEGQMDTYLSEQENSRDFGGGRGGGNRGGGGEQF